MTIALTGVNVAMSTAFGHHDQRLDLGRFRDHIDLLIEAGVHGIVVNSGTGEFAYMSDAEVIEITRLGAEHIAGRVPVIAQTWTVSLDLCIEKSKAVVGAGADALMVLPPWLEGPFAAGVMNHYLSLADAVESTYVLYNIPQVSGVEITPEMWAELSSHPNIGYIKDSTGDMIKMQALVAAGQGVLGGCDPIAPFAVLAGAAGWIWGAANVFPHECVQLWRHLKAGETAQALELWTEQLYPFNRFVWDNPFDADYITSVKTAASIRWGPRAKPAAAVAAHTGGRNRLASHPALSARRLGMKRRSGPPRTRPLRASAGGPCHRRRLWWRSIGRGSAQGCGPSPPWKERRFPSQTRIGWCAGCPVRLGRQRGRLGSSEVSSISHEGSQETSWSVPSPRHHGRRSSARSVASSPRTAGHSPIPAHWLASTGCPLSCRRPRHKPDS